MKRVCQKHRHEEAHVGAIVVCRHALVTGEVGMVMSLEKHVLLRALVRLYVHRTAARTPLIAACLQDRPVQASIPGEGAKWLFFSDWAGHMYVWPNFKQGTTPSFCPHSVR